MPSGPSIGGTDTRRAVELFTSVVAPTTLVTALLYWFGFEITKARSDYFGLDPGVLGFSTTDYLIRGVEAGIVPLLVLLLVVSGAAALHAVIGRLAERIGPTPAFRRSLGMVLGVAVAASALGTYGAFRRLSSPFAWYLLPPILVATGPLVAAFAIKLLAPGGLSAPRPSRVGAMAVAGLTVLGVFWGASLYADALGRGRAQLLAASLPQRARVTLFSERLLGIDPTVATVERLSGEENGRYPYRYSGLRFLLYSKDKYYLLPGSWTPATGTVLVLPDDSGIRVEFSPGEP